MKIPHPEPPELPITVKRRDKAKCLTLNSTVLKFTKKASMPNSVEIPGYIKC